MDTGAELSVLPPTPAERKWKTDFQVFTADGSPMETYGLKMVQVDLGLRRDFKWIFVVAEVEAPILGADFLKHFDLVADLKRDLLMDLSTGCSTKGLAKSTAQPSMCVTYTHGNEQFSSLLAEFPGIANPTGTKRPPSEKWAVQHFIETTGCPAVAKARRLTPEKLASARADFQAMLERGECRVGKGAWSSPLHMVRKPDQTWRMTGDYRALNAKTKPDRYPIPNILDFNSQLAGKKIFTKLDLVKAFYHIPMAEGDIEKTAVITPFGLFEFPCMPFGLRNAPQTFQRFIDNPVSYTHLTLPTIYSV